MLNYYDRIESYKLKNYFQINGEHLDLYYKKISEWIQDTGVAKDLLQLASENNLKNQYDILFFRVFGGKLTEKEAARLKQTLDTANIILASELGASDSWQKLGLPKTIDRHFSVIAYSEFKTVVKQPKVVKKEPKVVDEPKLEELKVVDEPKLEETTDVVIEDNQVEDRYESKKRSPKSS